MGSLTPGVKYIYERNGDTVYARELGADPSTRKEIGWDYAPSNTDRSERQERLNSLRDDQLWHKIRLAARDNVTLQDALDCVIALYHLSKDHGQT